MTDNLYSLYTLPTGNDVITIEEVGPANYRVSSRKEVIGEFGDFRTARNVVFAYLLGRGEYDRDFVEAAKNVGAYEVADFDPFFSGEKQ